ncbi:MAG: mannose-6-phosphate isomerase-like protein (cupin superfamily), partial [Paracoccaceae bacterium]
MIGYVGNIEELTKENTDFRRVLYSGAKLQLVLMSIEPGSEIGGEIHDDTDQFFCVED